MATTYHQQVDGCARLPDGDADFDRFRRAAENALFGAAADQIHFGALSPDGRWLRSYGQGAVFFRADHVAHRATVFEENVVLWFSRTGIAPVLPGGHGPVPPGYRAEWGSRFLLGVAKLAPVLGAEGNLDDLILHAGDQTTGDSFLEVHIFGPYTVRALKRVVVRRALFGGAVWDDLVQTANKYGIEVELIRGRRK